MNKPDILNQIKNRIDTSENGSIFVASDFADIADNKKIGTSLSRLADEGLLRRIMRGVYEKPVYSEFLGEYVAPSVDNVANAIARNYGWTIVPCGDTALNLLGLSTQISAVWLYISDGPYKEYSFDNVTIKFNRTTNKNISKLSYKTALVVQAIKAMGKENVDENIIAQLSKKFTDEEKAAMLTEAKITTSWIYDIIRNICKGNSK
ncbi:MAG: DUF6088 family protein [Clostridia bacterium]|nr:DUF6088 family protein [Clostridia bacterium]